MNDVSRNRSARDWSANGSAANGIEAFSPPRFASSLLEVETTSCFFDGREISIGARADGCGSVVA